MNGSRLLRGNAARGEVLEPRCREHRSRVFLVVESASSAFSSLAARYASIELFARAAPTNLDEGVASPGGEEGEWRPLSLYPLSAPDLER